VLAQADRMQRGQGLGKRRRRESLNERA